MNLVSRAVARIRTVLCGLRESDDPRPPLRSRSAPDPHPSLSPGCPSPEMWADFVAGARPHRGSHPRPHTAVPPITAADIRSTLVGAYLLPPKTRQRTLHATQLTVAR